MGLQRGGVEALQRETKRDRERNRQTDTERYSELGYRKREEQTDRHRKIQ